MSRWQSPRHAALSYLSRREYSQTELRNKLRSLCFGEEEIEQALQFCVEHHYLDDWRYGEMLLRRGCEKGYGAQLICQRMRQKGLQSELIASLLAQSEIDWFELARLAYVRKYSGRGGLLLSPIVDIKVYHQRMRFLLYRGFSLEQAQYALDV